MASFEIEWKRSAAKELRKLPKDMIPRIIDAVEGLAADPRPAGARKLEGSEHTYRIREGPYRVIYEVDAKGVTITIVKVAHRREVYRR
ncbi:MAG: type II toxin-antitoxin system RelE/ParE family toxin [Acidobacteriota bacterium]